MSTGTFKPLTVALASLALAGCDGLDLAGLGSAPEDGAVNFAMANAPLAGGAVTLQPPDGFCVDKSSLGQNFALLARCATLGSLDPQGNSPAAVITATTHQADDTAAPSADTLTATSETELARREDGDLILVQLRGTPPNAGMRDTYWRGLQQGGDVVLGLTLYEPKDGPSLGARAPELLTQTASRSMASVDGPSDTPATGNSATPPRNRASGGFLSRLFERNISSE